MAAEPSAPHEKSHWLMFEGVSANAAGAAGEHEWQAALVEGLARVISGLPPADAAAAALELGTPVLESLQQLMPQASGVMLPRLNLKKHNMG